MLFLGKNNDFMLHLLPPQPLPFRVVFHQLDSFHPFGYGLIVNMLVLLQRQFGNNAFL